MLHLLTNKLTALLALFISLVIFTSYASAKPPTEQFAPIWPDRASTLYDFESRVFSRLDNQHDFLVWFAIPKKTQPYAEVLYFIDGNASIQLIEDSDVNADKPLPFLVFIGYTNTLLFNSKARLYNYTPLIAGKNQQAGSGGADDFVSWIRDILQPHVKERIGSKLCRQTLWGHSYGGLFSLHVFFHYSNLFDSYFSADPALWWQDGAFIQKNHQLGRKNHQILFLERGSARFFQRSHTPQSPALQASISDWLKKLVKSDTAHITLEVNDLTHGEVFRSSAKESIQKVQNSAYSYCQ